MRTMMIREPEKRIPHVLEMLFPKTWLDAKNPSDPQGRTNREIQEEVSSDLHLLWPLLYVLMFFSGV